MKATLDCGSADPTMHYGLAFSPEERAGTVNDAAGHFMQTTPSHLMAFGAFPPPKDAGPEIKTQQQTVTKFSQMLIGLLCVCARLVVLTEVKLNCENRMCERERELDVQAG